MLFAHHLTAAQAAHHAPAACTPRPPADHPQQDQLLAAYMAAQPLRFAEQPITWREHQHALAAWRHASMPSMVGARRKTHADGATESST